MTTDRNKLVNMMTEDQVRNLIVEQRELERLFEMRKLKTEAKISTLKSELEEFKADTISRINEIKITVHGYLLRFKDLFVKPRTKTLKEGDVEVGKIGWRKEGGGMQVNNAEAAIVYIHIFHTSMVSKLIDKKEVLNTKALKKFLVDHPEININGITLTPKIDSPFYQTIKVPE